MKHLEIVSKTADISVKSLRFRGQSGYLAGMRINPEKPRIIVICGPTGIGKTTAAIELAQTFGGQIVGADAMQIYRQMDIGTAKPTPAEQAAVTHHMIDVVDPDMPFDAARYATMATDCIHHLRKTSRLPVVAGGTGFYIKALIGGLFDARPPDPQIRQRLEKQAETEGLAGLYAALKRSDPTSAERIHPNDRFRIIRALETLESTGQTISDLQQRHGFTEKKFEAFKIGLKIERDKLYARINQRVEAMITAGLLAEVQSLLDRGYGADLKSMQSIGYRHMVAYLAGQTPWDAAIALMQRDTRRYAKRQFTWFKSDPEIVWSAPAQIKHLTPAIEAFLEQGTLPRA